MEKLLLELQKTLPDVLFTPGEAFFWSPASRQITYVASQDSVHHTWSLLHETAHALLGHTSYHYDSELLLLETAAWQKATDLGVQFGILIDKDHIEDCLDTYRDWLHQRATCPRCSTVSLQSSPNKYTCHNCRAAWRVSTSRFCRPYRLSTGQNKKLPAVITQTTFQ